VQGFVNGDTLADLAVAPQPQTPYDKDSLAGDYPITFSNGQDARYSFITEQGMLRVLPTLPIVSLPEHLLNKQTLSYRIKVDDHGGRIDEAGLQLADAATGFALPSSVPLSGPSIFLPPYAIDQAQQIDMPLDNREWLIRAYARNQAGTAYSDTFRLALFQGPFLQIMHTPGRQQLTVLCGNEYQNGFLELRSPDGRIIFKNTLNQNRNEFFIPHLPTGIYLLSATQKNQKMGHTEKLLIR
jgi:hypothetical protein